MDVSGIVSILQIFSAPYVVGMGAEVPKLEAADFDEERVDERLPPIAEQDEGEFWMFDIAVRAYQQAMEVSSPIMRILPS